MNEFLLPISVTSRIASSYCLRSVYDVMELPFSTVMDDDAKKSRTISRQDIPVCDECEAVDDVLDMCTFEKDKARLTRDRRLLLLIGGRDDLMLAKSSAWKFFEFTSSLERQRERDGVESFQTHSGPIVDSRESVGTSTKSSVCLISSTYMAAKMTHRRRRRRQTGNDNMFGPWNPSMRQVMCAERLEHGRSTMSATGRRRQRPRRRIQGDRTQPEVENGSSFEPESAASISITRPDVQRVRVESQLKLNRQPGESSYDWLNLKWKSLQHYSNIHGYNEPYCTGLHVALNHSDRADTDQFVSPDEERFSVELVRQERKKHRHHSRISDGSELFPRTIADASSRQQSSSVSFDKASSFLSSAETTRLPKIASKSTVLRETSVTRAVIIKLEDFHMVSPLSIRPLDSDRNEPPIKVPYRYRPPEVDQLNGRGADEVKVHAEQSMPTIHRRREEGGRTDRLSLVSVEHGGPNREHRSSEDSASTKEVGQRRNTTHSMQGINASLFTADELRALLFLDLPSQPDPREDSLVSGRSSVIGRQALAMLLNGASARHAASHLSRADQTQQVKVSDSGREQSVGSTPKIIYVSLATSLKPVAFTPKH